jgi:prophage maintenance system killer protein
VRHRCRTPTRTAYVVCHTFLILSGHDIAATREEKHVTFLNLARGELSEDDLVIWIREQLKAL